MPRKMQVARSVKIFPFRFNEAAALMPRKISTACRAARSSCHQCFNEAAALMPRKIVLR